MKSFEGSRRGPELQAINECLDRLEAQEKPWGELPPWAQTQIRRARLGRWKALVAVKCGDCTAWQREEISRCPVTACPLHPVRPYQ